jgi:RTX calcium-binding nonapeptide repeat (4 copies)
VYAGAWPEEGPGGIWKTTDAGGTWTLLLEGPNVITQDRAHPNMLYAGGLGVYRSADAGATWTQLPGTEDRPVRGLAIDPKRPSHIVAARDKGVFESQDGGATWSELNAGLPHREVDQLAFDRTGRTLYVILTRGFGDEGRAAGVFSYTALHATPGPDRLVGTPDEDAIHALAGNDRVRALAGADRITGGRGNDILRAGPGGDRVLGGPGADIIHARDKERDVVRCGRGFDRVAADEGDVVARDCERVGRGIPQRPPPVFLVSRAGSQRSVQESFCVHISYDDGTGLGLCADTTDLEPRRLSVVRPGERITIRLRGATSAEGEVAVYPRGCEDRARWSFAITGRTTHWTVPRTIRREQRFELDLFADFTTGDGRQGDTSNTVGLLVSRARRREIIRAGTSLACGEPSPY